MYGTHIIPTPTGRFAVVGSVPESCLKLCDPPTRQQVMGGRVFKRDGRTIGWDGRAFDSREEAEQVIRSAGVEPAS